MVRNDTSSMYRETLEELTNPTSQDILAQYEGLTREKVFSTVSKDEMVIASRLCVRCSDAKLHVALLDRHESVNLDPVSSWEPETCDLCNFFSKAIYSIQPDHSSPNGISFQGHGSCRGYPAELSGYVGISYYTFDEYRSICFDHGWDDPGNSLTCLVRSDCDLSSQIEVTTPRIDFTMIRGWLKRAAIQEPCSVGSEGTNNDPLPGLHTQNTLSLTVIDCVSQTVVRLPLHTNYVTLSYVWGTSPGLCSNNLTFLELPPTIKDSIAVCQDLGYRYLWIDRYCIPQDDPQERSRQLDQMGAIYRESAFTIVACAGNDPQYGLAGVSRIRTPHPSILVKEVGYLQQIPVSADILRSVWAKRGWTYQEALLSQARLYFTDKQVYFENEHLLECEVNARVGVTVPEDLYREVGFEDDDWRSHKTAPWVDAKTAWSQDPFTIYDRIEEFSARSLSFPNDAIDAFQGILTVFEKKFQVLHVCGMPFVASRPRGSEFYKRPRPFLSHSLQFFTEPESLRCSAFPSWSWAGWTGKKHWDPNGVCEWRVNIDPCVAVELTDGRKIDWREFPTNSDMIRRDVAQSVKLIHIQGHVVSLPRWRKESSGDRVKMVADLPNSAFMSVRIQKEILLAIESQGLENYVFLRFPSDRAHPSSEHNLLIRNMGTHWERVTLCELYYTHGKERLRLAETLLPGVLQTIRMG